jgi:hypothetical protein
MELLFLPIERADLTKAGIVSCGVLVLAASASPLAGGGQAIVTKVKPGAVIINTSALQMRPSCMPQVGSWSGPEDGPPAADGALPRRLDLGEGYLIDVDRQVTSGGNSHEFWDCAGHLAGRYGTRAAAEHL